MNNRFLKIDNELSHCSWLGEEASTPEEISYSLVLDQLAQWRDKKVFQLNDIRYQVQELVISDSVLLLALERYETAILSEISSVSLDMFNLINAVFDSCTTQNEICFHGVKFIKDSLGIDRAGVLLLSENEKDVLGTWGTNEKGEMVSENDLVIPLEHNHWMGDSLARKGVLIVKKDVELTNYSDVVGKGWNAIVSIYHGSSPLGWLCCDNLVTGRPLTQSLESQITHFGTMLGQWLIRTKNESELVRLNENLEKEVEQKTEVLLSTIEVLRNTQDELVRKERTGALSTFTAGVAHEINNPIGFIRSNLSFIGKVSSKVLSVLEPMDNSGLTKPKGMLSEVDQVIDESVEGLDRIKNIISMLQPLNKLADEAPQTFDIVQAVEFAIMGLPDDSINVSVQASLATNVVNLPMQIFTLAFENVLENALQAVSEKSKPEIVVRVLVDKGYLIVSTQDNGKGISVDNIGSVFLPFFTTESPGEGLGLGLSLSQNLINIANGDMTVESEEGKGTTMNITFNEGVIQDV
jgi:signal transduction histidine kinase